MSSTLNELMLCANSWEPSVCLLGNVTARELRLFCAEWSRMKAELERANGLWRYWRNNDISETDDHWADFTNAVYAHLDGDAPVPERFIERPKPPTTTEGQLR